MNVVVTKNFGVIRVYRKFLLIIARSFPLMTGHLRGCLYKRCGVNIHNPKSLYIGYDVTIDGLHPEDIYIGDGCVITDGVKIITHFYKPDDHCMYRGEVHIGNSVFIGMNALIVNAVKIGDNAVIGAGSVVTKDIPENEIWGGESCKIFKKEKIILNI